MPQRCRSSPGPPPRQRGARARHVVSGVTRRGRRQPSGGHVGAGCGCPTVRSRHHHERGRPTSRRTAQVTGKRPPGSCVRRRSQPYLSVPSPPPTNLSHRRRSPGSHLQPSTGRQPPCRRTGGIPVAARCRPSRHVERMRFMPRQSEAVSITMLDLVGQAIAAADGTQFQADQAKYRRLALAALGPWENRPRRWLRQPMRPLRSTPIAPSTADGTLGVR